MKVIKFHNNLITFKKRSIIHKSIITYDYAITFNIYFVKNGRIHNSKYPAEIICTKYKEYYKYHALFDQIYFRLEKSWRKQAKNIIRQHKLKVFQ